MESAVVTTFKSLSLGASITLAVAGGAPAFAQQPTYPWIEMDTTSIGLGLAGQTGEGILHLPNLGTNCSYPFKVSGFGGGIQVGVSKVSASGPVANMTRVSDLSGEYGATEGEITLLAGAGGSTMKNRNNNVAMSLKSETQGIGLGFVAKGMAIRVADQPVNLPRADVVDFGFNKNWVSKESRATLDKLVSEWKCRYANIWL